MSLCNRIQFVFIKVMCILFQEVLLPSFFLIHTPDKVLIDPSGYHVGFLLFLWILFAVYQLVHVVKSVRMSLNLIQCISPSHLLSLSSSSFRGRFWEG